MGKRIPLGDAYPPVPAYRRVLVAGRPYSPRHLARKPKRKAVRMLNVYGEFAEKYMAVPVVKGVKSANERFAGALNTYTIEAMMQGR